MTAVWYATREDVMSALDVKLTARDNAQVDRAIDAASRSVEGLLNRRFYPTKGTRYKDWPNTQDGTAWRVWLDADEVIAVTTLTSGGTTISSSDYNLEPANTGPPYSRIEIDLSSTSAFSTGSTPQRSIAITGTFGYTQDTNPAGTLAAAISSTSATTCTVSDSSLVGVGSILAVDSERMIVTGKTMLTTAQTSSITASNADVTLAVTSGSSYAVGEVVLLDSERMLIVDIAGNNLTVKRAWDGTVLAAHTTATIYALRTLTITRGALGTTAATHSNAAALTTHAVPGTIRALCVAEAINTLEQELAGYARTTGSGDTLRLMRLDALQDIRGRAQADYGRRARTRVV